jgi:hypothetical protein
MPQEISYSNLVDMWGTGQPCIDCHPKITGGIEEGDWLPEQLCWSGLKEKPSGYYEDHAGAVHNNDDEPPFF